MNTTYSTEISLEKMIAVLLDENKNPDFIDRLLGEETTLFEILSNLSSKGISQLVVKLSFCIIILLVSEWKKRGKPQDLPTVFFNYFKVTGKFIHFAYTKEIDEHDLEIYCEPLLEQSADSSHLLLFVPDKFIKEKRLYKITKEDIERIKNSGKWSKLPDPHNCQSWIKLPSNFNQLRGIGDNKKFNKEFLSGFDPTEESIAKRLIFRNNQSSKRSTNYQEQPKTSLFKRKADSEKGTGLKRGTQLSPNAFSEDSFEPGFFKSGDLCKRIPTQISQSTKLTGQDSPGLETTAHFFDFNPNSRKQSPTRSLIQLVPNEEDPNLQTRMKRYTVFMGSKKLLPT